MDNYLKDSIDFDENGTNPPKPVGERYDAATALKMLTRWPLGELMGLAHKARMNRLPRNQVTFVVDTNPNYTNICVTGCRFCAFFKPPGAQGGYTLTPAEVAKRVSWAAGQGATTVLLQGGHNPAIGLSDWKAYIQAILKACPKIHIHPFSPAEVVFMAQKEGLSVYDVLKTIHDLGITTLPGGGAEILSDRVRTAIAPAKATSQEWLEANALAHSIGFKTTATLMYGHVEKDQDIIAHMLKLRDLQDQTQGFTSFIAWSFKPGNTALAEKVSKSVHPAKYVRLIATARLVLDNFQHIQSSWFSESLAAGQLGLLAGADDFGGVLVEENVLQTAGHHRSTTISDVKTMIARTGFTPAQRDSSYRILKSF